MSERIPKFKNGDKVKLTTGGPEMNIAIVHTSSYYGKNNSRGIPTIVQQFNGDYTGQWFVKEELRSGIFPEESLVAV